MDLEIRPARPEDRQAVLAISAQVWEGQDYLPEVWEQWLHDPAGPLMVALSGGQPVAVDKIILQGPDEAWLAGMRVGLAHRGQGIATALTAYNLRWLEARHVSVARFATASDNTPVHRLAEHLGFDLLFAVYHLRRPLRRGSPALVPRLLRPHEEDVAWAILSESSFLRATGGLYGLSWTWMRFTRARLSEHLDRGEVFGWGEGPDAVGIVIYRSPQSPRYVAMLAGERRAGLSLVRALLADPQLAIGDPDNPPHLRLAVPEGVEDLRWIAERAGLESPVPWHMWLYQRDARDLRV